MIPYAVVDDALSPDFPLGVELEVFVRRVDSERLVEEVVHDSRRPRRHQAYPSSAWLSRLRRDSAPSKAGTHGSGLVRCEQESRRARAQAHRAPAYVVRSDWGDAQPKAADQDVYLAAHTWEEYAAWHLGLTEGPGEETKGIYAFVYGDFRRVHRSGLIACVYRAADRDPRRSSSRRTSSSSYLTRREREATNATPSARTIHRGGSGRRT